ncbi:MAG: regulatory protein RecX [Polyangiaceae bacterium]|nr:regulatory protein RecX [Polyangiaceae bacterium]
MKKSGPDSKDALGAAMRLLGVRQRSVFELRGRLIEKGFGAEAADAAIEKLLAAGYLDDAAFARALAASRAANKAWGPARIARDLSMRGIAKEIVKEAVSSACPEEQELAEAAFERWKKRNKGRTGREEMKKAFRHLSARGFSPSVIWKVLGRPVEDGQD